MRVFSWTEIFVLLYLLRIIKNSILVGFDLNGGEKMKKKSLYARCEVARTMVQDRRAFAPRVVQSKKRKVERKPWRAYLEV